MSLQSWLGQTVHSLSQDLRTLAAEAPPRRRYLLIIRHMFKVLLASLFFVTGLTGYLLRRTLQSSQACLILGYHGTTGAPPGYFSRGHWISNVRGQMQYLKRYLRLTTLEEIAEAIAHGEPPPEAAVAVTFDDGLTNNALHAIPMLQELNAPATFFVPSGFVGSSSDLWISSLREIVLDWPGETVPEMTGLWPDLPARDEATRYAAFYHVKEVLKSREGDRPQILDRLAKEAGGYLRPPAEDRVVDRDLLLRMVQPGLSVGAHSRSHPILSSLDCDSARAEIEGSRRDLEEMLGRPVLDFAYPNGRFADFDEAVCRLVAEAGFRCAVTTEPGTVRRGDDRLALRRCLPRNVPVFLASFELLTRVWADRRRPGDLAVPLEARVSCLGPREARTAP